MKIPLQRKATPAVDPLDEAHGLASQAISLFDEAIETLHDSNAKHAQVVDQADAAVSYHSSEIERHTARKDAARAAQDKNLTAITNIKALVGHTD